MSVMSKEAVQISEVERAEILRQTDRLLSSRQFSGSKRYPAFLRFVIQETLEGHQDVLKERTIGIEVFDREPSFDTSGDSIVRVTAAEVRKRIAQYYQAAGHESELRIELPSGSYVPHFKHPSPVFVSSNLRVEPSTAPATVESAKPLPATRVAAIQILAALVLSLLAIAGWKYWTQVETSRNPFASFWDSRQPFMVCIGSPLLSVNQPGADKPEVAAALGQPTTNNTLVPLSDAITLGRLQAELDERHKDYRVLLARHASLDDLRSGPTILIGALDNPWTMRLTSKLRFQFRGNESTSGAIVDTKSQGPSQWNVDFQVPYSDRTQDYAIVAMTHDDTSGQPLLIAAGAGPNGTRTAGEFLTSADDIATLEKMEPSGWRGGSVEVVLATQVIQGNSGPPRIVAAEFW